MFVPLIIFGTLLFSPTSSGENTKSAVMDVLICPGSNLTLTGGWNATVPGYLYGMDYVLRGTIGSVSSCKKKLTETKYSFLPGFNDSMNYGEIDIDGDFRRDYMVNKTFLSPEGFLSVEGKYYGQDEYCVSSYFKPNPSETLPELSLLYCDFNPAVVEERRPVIKKCCPLGMSLTNDCVPTPPSKNGPKMNWNEVIYDKRTWKRLAKKEEVEIKPRFHYNLLHCKQYEEWYAREVVRDNFTNPKQAFRLLSDGSLIFVNGKREWELLDGEFCIEVYQGENAESSPEKWGESDLVIVVCGDEFVSEKSRSQSTLYMYFLFVASFFFFLTALVHLLLWDKQNTNGWTIFFLTLSQGFMGIFMGNAHRLGLNGSSSIRYSPQCVVNAILGHFFWLAAFCWLTLLNFTIWSAFRSLTPKKGGTNRKKLLFYVLFGFGAPLVVVSVGLILQTVFPDRESLVKVPEYGNNRCFVAEYAEGVYGYYFLPLLFTIIFGLAGTTCYKLYTFQKDTEKVRQMSSAKERQMGVLYTKLSVVLGISWVFEYISWQFTSDGQSWWWVIPDFYNLGTSIAIFIIFACKQQTLQNLEQKYYFLKPITQGITWITISAKQTITPKGEQGSGSHTHSTAVPTVSGSKMDNLRTTNPIDISMPKIEKQGSEFSSGKGR